ncbi:MAG: pirin family protein [Alphaproteobacteria bacterium]|nr:pirin family protein [Alphaproteobacteria bacterium]
MITIRPSHERGSGDYGWLAAKYTFSFADYQDPAHMGFRALRVINEDWVKPGMGFKTHGHSDMEIVTYVLSGAIAHKDSLGNGSTIRPGDVQRMSAGTGILHSEFNPSDTEPEHHLQIWLLPERTGLMPGYEQKKFPIAEQTDHLHLIASRDARLGSVTIHQDADIYACRLSPGGRVSSALAPGRHAWIQAARGAVEVNGVTLRAGDGAAISDEDEIDIRSRDGGEFLLFDLA